MAQIQSPETYVDGQQVTAARLNNQTNGATLLPGAITDQSALTSNTADNADVLLAYDVSAVALRKITISDILNSGLSWTTSTINGFAGADISIVPAAGYKAQVTGNFTVTGNLITSGNNTVNGNGSVVGTFGVTSNTTIGGTLSVANDVSLTGTGALKIPTGTTIQRPSTPSVGQIRFNTTSTVLEVYSGSAWVDSPNTAYIDAKPFAKAYVKFAGATGTVAKQNNVSSVTRNSTGNYTINFTNPLADADYVIVGSIVYNSSQSTYTTTFEVLSQSVTSFTVWTRGHGNTLSASVQDCPSVYIAVFGT